VQYNLTPTGAAKQGGTTGASRFANWHDLDGLVTHPTTGAVVFVGNAQAAGSKAILAKHGIRHIVNCQGLDSANYHEADRAFAYLRFPVQNWWRDLGEGASDAAVLAYFGKLFAWVDAATAQGPS